MSRYKIIYNPSSRGGKSRKKYSDVINTLNDFGLDYEIENTTGPKSAIEQVERSTGFDSAVAMGGDGTVHEVANGCIRAGIPLGVIPLGSGNDFANGIGITTWQEAIEVLSDGKTVPISVLKSDKYTSINVIDSGLGADIVKLSERHLKWISGQKKYTLLTLGGLTKHRGYNVRITVDGESNEYKLNILAMGCGQTFGSGMRILPDARYNHDEMQIAIVHSANRLKVLRLFSKVFGGKHVHIKEHVTMLTGKTVEIELLDDDREMFIEAEGEIIGTAPMKIELVPRGLQVHVPEEWSADKLSSKVK